MTPRPVARLVAIVLACSTLAACTSGGLAGPHRTAAGTPTAATSSSAGASPGGPSTASPGSTGARTAIVLGSGDVLIHPALTAQAHADAAAEGRAGYDFGAVYASIAPDVHGVDLATCELETPLALPRGPFAGWPDFSAPPQVLTALTGVGYRTCTTASNHSLDQGYGGLVRTLDEVDAAGLRHTGSARSAAEAARPLIVTTASGVRIGQLAYSFNFNGRVPTAGRAWEANVIDVPTILAAARRLKRAGADVVVLSMHWGTEYDHLATSTQRSEAARLLASPDIDLILGDHAHVVQPAQRIDGKWVFYCMGNQVSRHADPIAEGRQGVMPRVTFTETSPHHFRATSVEALPTWMEDSPALRLVDLPRALASTTLTPAQRTADTTARTAIVRYLNAYGAITQGLRVR